MAEFAYHVIDANGREKHGRISAANDDTARARLTAQKLYIVALDEASA